MNKSELITKIVTDKIIAELENGSIPWVKGWKSFNNQNYETGHVYTGINRILTGLSGFTSPYWLTYKAIERQGGTIKNGQQKKYLNICHSDTYIKTEKNKKTGEEEITKKYSYIKYFRIWNYEQTEGIPEKKQEIIKVEPLKEAEKIIKGYKDKPRITNGVNQACYIPSTDNVQMPDTKNFLSMGNYYATLFHEFGHSTGHKTRLDRELKGQFGSEDYSKEELIAELTSAFLCNQSGIEKETIKNSTAYIQNWLKVLKDDRDMIIKASRRAEESYQYILGEYKGENKNEQL